MKRTIIFILGLISIISLISGCGEKTKKLEFSMGSSLKPLPNKSDLTSYISSSLSTPTSTPNIFLFIIDTLRADHINAKDTPNLYSFTKKYGTPKRSITGATATHHATYGLFFSRPAYERKPIINSGWDTGSIHMQILKNGLGYAIRPYAAPSSYFCTSSAVSFSDVRTEPAQMQILFGSNTSLLSTCNNSPSHLLTGSDNAQRDSAAIDRFINDLSTISAATKQFSFIHIESPHPKFSWLDSISNLYTPNFKDTAIREEGAVFRPNHDEVVILRNSYKNGVKSADYQFGRFIAALKGVAGSYYKDSIVAVVSDHGENLYENNNHFAHGGPAHREVTDIVMSIKFSGADETTDVYHQVRDVEMASLLDLFPTMYESIGMTNYAQTYYMGESLLSKTMANHLVVTPNGVFDTPQFCLVHKDYKIYGSMNYSDTFMNSSSFEIFKITDPYDNDLNFNMDNDELLLKIREDFSDLFSKMYN